MEGQELINQIRNKLDIVDVISEYIPLIQKGKNYFGVCPFHDDNHPSMSVSKDKQIYKCFSCGASGNVFNFIMDYEHIEFKEALQLLGEKTGISIGNIKINKENNKYEKLYEAYILANKYYQNNINTNSGKIAKEYLKQRKINEEIIKEFSIGLSLKGKDNLLKLLTTKGFDNEDLNLIGLTNNNYDTYIDRIIFPLCDINGKVVGFSGRIYNNSNLNKYLNTKETPIFKKGHMLYNYHRAKEEARRDKFIIIMEGFMDVIRAYTNGIKNVVALMGTALTSDQVNLIKRLSNNVVLCFDGDDAGRHATMSVGNQLTKAGFNNIKVISLKNNDDPDTYIIKEGKDSFISLIENAINYNDYKIQALKSDYNLNSDIEKSDYINKVLEEVSKIDDSIRKEIILKSLAKEFNLEYNTLDKRLIELNSNKGKITDKKIANKVTRPKNNKYVIASYAFLYYMLTKEEAINLYDTDGINFPGEKERFLASEISYYYSLYGIINIADFYTYLQDKKELSDVLKIVLSYEFVDDIKYSDILDYAKVIREYNKTLEIDKLKVKMKNEINPLEKAKIAEKIRMLKVGSV